MSGVFGGGETTTSTVTPNLPVELRGLYGLQGEQFRQTFPLLGALTESEAALGGFSKQQAPNPLFATHQALKDWWTRGGDVQLPDMPWGSNQTPIPGWSTDDPTGALRHRRFQELEEQQPFPTTVSYDYTGQSPLISALQSSFTLRPEELALPGRIRDINVPLLASLQRGTTDYGTFTNTLSDAILRGADQPLDTESMLFGINQQLERNLLPEVRSASIRMGHSPDVTSSGYSRLLGDVSRQYGGAVSETLAKSELGRREQATRAQTLANLVRTGGQENLRASLPLLQALGLSGPQAEAMLAAQLREAGARRAQVPLELIRQRTVQPPSIPNYASGQTTTGTQMPTTGAQIGAGLNQALLLALLSSAAFGRGGGSSLFARGLGLDGLG